MNAWNLSSSTIKRLLACFHPQIHDRGPSENGRHVHTNDSFGLKLHYVKWAIHQKWWCHVVALSGVGRISGPPGHAAHELCKFCLNPQKASALHNYTSMSIATITHRPLCGLAILPSAILCSQKLLHLWWDSYGPVMMGVALWLP